jgi:hypothetical protein
MQQTAVLPEREHTPNTTAHDHREPVFGDDGWKCPLDHTPNAETIKALQDTDLISFNSLEEFFADLDNDVDN